MYTVPPPLSTKRSLGSRIWMGGTTTLALTASWILLAHALLQRSDLSPIVVLPLLVLLVGGIRWVVWRSGHANPGFGILFWGLTLPASALALLLALVRLGILIVRD